MNWFFRRSIMLAIMALGYAASVAAAMVTHDLRLVNTILAFVWAFGLVTAFVFYNRMTTVDKDKYSANTAAGYSLMIGAVSVVMSALHYSWRAMPPTWLVESIPLPTLLAVSFMVVACWSLVDIRKKATSHP